MREAEYFIFSHHEACLGSGCCKDILLLSPPRLLAKHQPTPPLQPENHYNVVNHVYYYTE